MKAEIKNIIEQNKIYNLKNFIKRRQRLNVCNGFLSYFFNIVQAGGIFVTTISAGCNIEDLVWVGIGLNVLATLIYSFQDTNSHISRELLDDITDIKNEYLTEVIIESIIVKKMTDEDYLISTENKHLKEDDISLKQPLLQHDSCKK